jgi:hypothetical protein
MESIKGDKAKEYAEGMETSFSEQDIKKSIEDFKAGYDAGFEAGKQEERKTLIEELKSWAKKDFEEYKKIFPGDWNPEDETFSLEIILDKLTELENLSK